MSLEAKIELLTAAVVELTRALTEDKQPQEVNIYPNGPADGQTAKSADKSAATETATSSEAATTVKAEVPNGKSSPTTDTSPPSSNESPAVTYDEVSKSIVAVSKIDRAKAIAALARFGVKNGKELTKQQWPDVLVYMKRVAAGEIDPESSHE
jgi:hypothetical protein